MDGECIIDNMKATFKPKKILWIDLEMTGLDPVRDEGTSLIDFLNCLCYNNNHGKIKPDSE